MAARSNVVTVDRLPEFTDRIDVRSPAEYLHDHLPGAASHPVLDDDERARIGTLHAQESAFAAKRAGAALVARNIADMLASAFAEQPREWQPLVYCWRGGKRSGSLTHILNEVGWHAVQLEGGYKAYRRHVIDRLAELPEKFSYRVICGVTGSGKSRLLQALEVAGAQVVDLEVLAQHRGSLLGDIPQAPQPSQKAFETALCARLEALDPARPVYVESESKKVGEIRVPQNLIERMWQSACVRVETLQPDRIALLSEEYAHFIADPAALNDKLRHLRGLHGADTTTRWSDMATAGDWAQLIPSLLAEHYDPAYLRSMRANYPHYDAAASVALEGIDEGAFAAAAGRVVAAHGR